MDYSLLSSYFFIRINGPGVAAGAAE